MHQLYFDPTATRQMLYLDFIIGSLTQRTNDLRSELGNLNEANGSFACIIYDFLSAMGLPAGVIRMVLGPEADQIDDQPGESISCYFCNKPAVGLIQAGKGWRLACEDHGKTLMAE